jgi:hypothetical protein
LFGVNRDNNFAVQKMPIVERAAADQLRKAEQKSTDQVSCRLMQKVSDALPLSLFEPTVPTHCSFLSKRRPQSKMRFAMRQESASHALTAR